MPSTRTRSRHAAPRRRSACAALLAACAAFVASVLLGSDAAAQPRPLLTPGRDGLPIHAAAPLGASAEEVLLHTAAGPLVFSLSALGLRPHEPGAAVAGPGLDLAPRGTRPEVRLSDGVVRWFAPPDTERLALLVLDARRFVLWSPTGYAYAHGDGSDDALGAWVELADGNRRFVPLRLLWPRLRRPDLLTQALERSLPAGPGLGPLPRLGRVVGLATRGRGGPLWATVEIFAPAGPSTPAEPGSRGLQVLGGPPPPPAPRVSWREEVPVPLPSPPRTPAEPRERLVPLWPPSLGGRSLSVRLVWDGAWRAAPPDLYLLAVGVNEYQDRERIAPLRFAHKDARDLAAALGAQAGRRYRRVHRLLLTDAEATLPRLRDGLAWLRREAREDDVVMLFLAGHGVTTHDGEPRYYFLPAEAALDRPRETALSGDELFTRLSAVRAESVVLFLDTCKAGTSPAQRRLLERLQTATSTVVFSATRANRPSLESARWENGAFTRALVEGLRGAADASGEGRVTASSLETYLNQRVRELTAGDQEPTTVKATSDLWLAQGPRRLHRRWWLWAGVSAAVAVTAVGLGLGLGLRPSLETLRFDL